MIGIGWVNYFEGRVAICVGALIVGAIVTVILSLVRAMLHRQTIREFGRWALLFAAIFVAPALLALIAVTSVEVVHRAPAWVWPALVCAVLFVVGFRLVRGRQPAPKHLRPLNPTPEPAPELWSMPVETEWDR